MNVPIFPSSVAGAPVAAALPRATLSPAELADAEHHVYRTRRISRVTRSLFALGGALEALALVLVASGASAGARQTFFVPMMLATPLLFVAFATLVWWMNASSQTAEKLARATLGISAGGIVLSFLFPIVNLFRPYQLLRAVDDALDPNDVPMVLRPDPRGAERGYRDDVVTNVQTVPRAPIGVWWGAWVTAVVLAPLAGGLYNMMIALSPDAGAGPSALSPSFNRANHISLAIQCCGFVVASALTTVMISKVSARMDERLRRLRAAAQS